MIMKTGAAARPQEHRFDSGKAAEFKQVTLVSMAAAARLDEPLIRTRNWPGAQFAAMASVIIKLNHLISGVRRNTKSPAA
jgi:hypothetical protein